MTQRVFTANGPGRVVQSETVRGRESLLVEGDGFSRWFFANELSWDETPAEHVNEKNTTTLPYDPKPQTVPHTDISTILPGVETIDRSERLSPSDSLSGDGRDGERTPGPNPDLFADVQMGRDEYLTDTQLPGEQGLYHASIHEAAAVGADPAEGRWVVIADTFNDRYQTSNQVLAEYAAAHPEVFSGGYRAARVAGEANPYADVESLMRTSATMRQAAWADVREKALRLRRTGCVSVVDEDVKSIMANVQGDHGLYDTFVIRQAHLAGNSSVSEWSCSCEWGYWAFKRKRSFVGRMCSHAYAAYLELQSMNHRQKRRTSMQSDDYLPMGKYVDEKLEMPSELRMEPDGVVPQFNIVERPEREVRQDKLSSYLRQASDDALLEDLRALSEETHRPQHEQERRDEIAEVVEQLRERGYDADQLVASLRTADPIKVTDQFVHEPFNGSGPTDHHQMSTTEDARDDWYEDPRLEEQELADDSYEPDTSPGGTSDSDLDKYRLNKSSAVEDDDEDDEPGPEADDGDGDEDPDYVVAQFQRSAAASSLMGGGSAAGGGDGDIAGAANRFLRTAGRNYSFAEQQALIDEGQPGAASNLSDLQLEGTHYLA
ncbi:LysM-like protein [Rhodococcus phage E3]|uniref:LysM-like protein n=1 Tax=Rhodococcus phage E3 TaxID=1007869 RepID=UPI0002C6D5CE|nr:LysM-like protein [Rhodococcus phage E3]AEQ20989.1 LysM-like protein [Rhodococcus phage E3]